LAKNEIGYRNLLYLTSVAFNEGMSVRPRIDMDILSKRTDGIVCLSGCLSGPINDLLLQDKSEEALAKAMQLKDMFGADNFWLELQRNGINIQDKANTGILEISKKINTPLVATNDIHYLRGEDCDFQDTLLCVATGSRKDDENRFRFDTSDVYLKTQQEMTHVFRDLPDSLKATKAIEEMIDLDIEQGKFVFPEYNCEAETPELELKGIVADGIQKIYSDSTKAKERAARELEVINRMGYPEYFLIVRDIICEAKARGIPVGPGRGSAAGSIVAYACGITDVDPLRYNLLFERFLTDDRVGLPDIDVDFCKEGRAEVIEFMRERYGEDRVANIITFGRFGSKSAVRQTARVLDIPLREADGIAKKVPEGLNIEETIKKDPSFKTDLNKWPGLEIASRKMEGFVSHAGIHASGVVVGDRPLYEIVPMGRNSKGIVTTQWDGDDCERIGLVKFDILGLSTLTVINNCCKLIEERGGKRPKLDQKLLKDEKLFKIFSEGDTEGIFQCSSGGIAKLLVDINTSSIDDVAAALALFRPGPLESGIVEQFIDRKHGREPVVYVHSSMKKYLKNTFGLMVYQEQIMQTATELAGFTLKEADGLRKAVGKKKMELLNPIKDKWLNGCKTQKKISETKASSLWEDILKFGRYGFNLSHAVSYAYISLWTAHLKCYHPVEFFAANLTEEANTNNATRIKAFIHDARAHDIDILPPDVRNWAWDFKPVNDKAIRMGVSGMKNIGRESAELLADTKFTDSTNIFEVIAQFPEATFRKDTLEACVRSGALDFTGTDRGCIMDMLPDLIKKTRGIKSRKKSKKSKQLPLFDTGFAAGVDNETRVITTELDESIVWSKTERLTNERAVYEFYLSGHPMADKKFTTIMAGAKTIGEAFKESKNKEFVRVGCVITDKEIKTIKNGKNAGKKYARLMIEDSQHQATAMLFSHKYDELYETVLQYFTDAEPVIISGTIDINSNDLQMVTTGVRKLSSVDKVLSELLLTLENIGNIDTYEEISRIFKENPGDTIISFKIPQADGSSTLMRLDQGVDITNKLVQRTLNRFI
jgi:DNA polymerase-3 subunit alpha